MSIAEARRCIASSAPRTPQAHALATTDGFHLFISNGSRLYDVDRDLAAACADSGAAEMALSRAGLLQQPYIDDAPLTAPPLRALSLSIAQKCNLGCVYCYAEQGDFGGSAKNMTFDEARRAIDLLMADATRGARYNIAFLGGEPLINRSVLREATLYAQKKIAATQASVSFSITTNGTLVCDDAADFFETHGFAVTVSVDGSKEAHDALRPYKSGRGSFDEAMRRVAPLLRKQRAMQVSARVTVTPANIALRETLDALVERGFHSVGFSPMLSSPSGKGEMRAQDLETMLAGMIECGAEFERRARLGERYPFANLTNALSEIHRGTHRPYPCGAGAGYLGVSADGELAACHRFVADEQGAMGTLATGVDREAQQKWLSSRHVHRQEPCNACWARYLCGGGCHHEVIRGGRPACDYIRGWLHYCIESYLRLSELSPFAIPEPAGPFYG